MHPLIDYKSLTFNESFYGFFLCKIKPMVEGFIEFKNLLHFYFLFLWYSIGITRKINGMGGPFYKIPSKQ
jgi:hypothetical protein